MTLLTGLLAYVFVTGVSVGLLLGWWLCFRFIRWCNQ